MGKRRREGEVEGGIERERERERERGREGEGGDRELEATTNVHQNCIIF